MQQLFRNSAATHSFGRGIGSYMLNHSELRGGEFVPDTAHARLSERSFSLVTASSMGIGASGNQSIMFHR